MSIRVTKEEIVGKLFSKDVIDKIEGKINKNGVDGINIKDLIVYISAFFNDETSTIEKGIKGLGDNFNKFSAENKKLKLFIIAILIPLWGLFLQSIFFKWEIILLKYSEILTKKGD